ncbi:unnamed protein product [Ectocarpus sp. CCAP 1310/34]|nr:unnamed protein product [Ectocarpus sp. CCAP 1310/34]
MGSVVLCSFSKATSTAAVVLNILGFIADAFSALLLITWLHGVFDGGFGVADEVFVLLLVIHAIAAPLTFLAGSVFAFKAVFTWTQGGGAARHRWIWNTRCQLLVCR